MKYGKLTLVKEVEPHITPGGTKKRQFLCKCDCGDTKTVCLSSLKSGNTRSCGCFKKESLSSRSSTHKMSKHPLYGTWCGMKGRCSNANKKEYKHYGGRGINVCKKWEKDFMQFYEWAIANGWEKGLEIDRKNNNRGYCPSNCRFVTRSQNCRNKRGRGPSKYRGVYKRSDKWGACISFNKKTVNLGIYTSEKAALRAVNKGNKKYYPKATELIQKYNGETLFSMGI